MKQLDWGDKMLNRTQLESLLTLAMQSDADFAEIFEEETHSERFSVVNENVEDVNRTIRAGAGIRLYKGTSSVYGYTNEMNMASLEAVVRDLRDAIGKQETGTAVVLNEREVVKNISPVEQNPQDADDEVKIDLLKECVKGAEEYDERIFKVTASLNFIVQDVQIANSEGLFKADTRVRTRIGVSAYAKEGDNVQSGFNGPGASKGLEYFTGDHAPYEAGKEAARVACVLLRAKKAPSGVMPVIIDNGFGGVIFHEACGHSLEATGVAKNLSVFSGKKGEKIASEKVNAVDDGTLPGEWGSQNMDDEGNPQQRRLLIQNGVLTEYMVDRLNGRRMNEKSSGSARRESYKYEPTSRMSNTYLLPGTDKREDMFKDIKFGLYCRSMGGGSVNPNTGEFNFGVNEGYLIEDGKVTDPVIGAMLIGSGSEILKNIDMVSDDLALAQGMCGSVSGSIPTNVGQPTIRVSSITVGGTDNE